MQLVIPVLHTLKRGKLEKNKRGNLLLSVSLGLGLTAGNWKETC